MFPKFANGKDYISHLTAPAGSDHRMSVERLTPDFVSSSRVTSGYFGGSDVEAPVLFKRGSAYYALFGMCCCFCGEGSGTVVHTAPQSGMAARTDGIWGVRVNHVIPGVQVTDLGVTN